MSLDTVVAFVRNGLCCIKDLGLLSTSVLYKPSYMALFYTFPAPFDEITPLEFIIGLCQIYAVVSMTLAGIRSINDGMSTLRRIGRLRSVHGRKGDTDDGGEQSVANRVVLHSLEGAHYGAVRNIYVGINVMSIGLAFSWLVANSFHLTATGWIGGVQGLIHALTVAEIGLLSLLYCMVVDGSSKLKDALRINLLREKLTASRGRLANVTDKGFVADSQMYGWLVHGGWKPFWNETVSPVVEDENNEERMLVKEVTTVQTTVDALFAEEKKTSKRSAADGEDEHKALSYAVHVASTRLEHEASLSRVQGILEYVYFILNFIAFYGYMICILSFYMQDGEGEPGYWTKMKLGMSNKDADWTGNFAGDLCWTIEPFTALVATYSLNKMSHETKVKSD